ncbi:MAG: hypothetical protein AAF597_02215 [Bacteroidota bacterium]
MWKLTFIALVLCFVAACDDDDEPIVCLQDNWVGSYTGTISCDDGQTAQDVNVTITASGTDQIVISTQTGNTSTFYDPITIMN